MPHPACHGVFVAGDWEVIEGRKFRGWILTERLDELIPDLQLKDGRHITFWTPCQSSPKRPSFGTVTAQMICLGCGRNGKRSPRMWTGSAPKS
jgi:hypothetical protein